MLRHVEHQRKRKAFGDLLSSAHAGHVREAREGENEHRRDLRKAESPRGVDELVALVAFVLVFP